MEDAQLPRHWNVLLLHIGDDVLVVANGLADLLLGGVLVEGDLRVSVEVN